MPSPPPAAIETIPDRAVLDEAYARVRRYAHRTPVLRSSYFDRRTGAEVFFKCENLQKVGAFKFRGAVNALFSLADQALARGVVTHSSGNHAQAVALAARLRGVAATIVMPENASAVKVAAVRGYGAKVALCAPTLAARRAGVEEIIARDGALLIHPYDDWRIVAGQATAARELLEQVGELDTILVPVGGGGLAAGSALTVHHLAPGTRVIGAEPAAADDAMRSLERGTIQPANDPVTVADGLRTSLGERTFAVLREHVARIVTVEEATIVDTMKRVWERMKIVIEPSSAVPLAALLAGAVGSPEEISGTRIGIVLSGGNVDLDRLPWTATGEGA